MRGVKRKPEELLRICPQCGAEFEAVKEYSGFRRKYCSRACNGKASRERAARSYPPREEIERLYLDDGLSDRALGERFGHSYQWAFKVRRHYGIPGRREVGFHTRNKPLTQKCDRTRWHISLKREDRCRNCGRPDGGEGGRLQLHHAIPRSMSRAAKFDLRNGVPLCVACHMAWHRRAIVIYRDIFTAEEWAFISSVQLLGQNLDAWLDDRYPTRSEYGPPICSECGWANKHRFDCPVGARDEPRVAR